MSQSAGIRAYELDADQRPGRKIDQTLVSVVLPVYNEAGALWKLVELVTKALSSTGCDYELVFVNDGSTDDSPDMLSQLAKTHSSIRIIHLSRNFGHPSAVHAGLRHASGDVVILMDSDLQDDPSCLPRFLKAWEMGADVVYAVRAARKEHPAKRLMFYSFYRVLNWLASSPLPNDAGNFSLLDRQVVDEICELPETDRYFPGLRNWVGFRQQGVVVERLARHDDHPRVTIWQLFRLAKAAIFGFSAAPLTLFYFIGAASLLVCLGASGFCLYHKCITGLAIPGWSSITIASSFFGALNALGIAVLGEYVARIYDQVRARPQFVVRETEGWGGDTESDGRSQEVHGEEWMGEIQSISAALSEIVGTAIEGGGPADISASTAETSS